MGAITLTVPEQFHHLGQPAKPGPSDVLASRILQLGLQASPPGQWAANKYEQLNHFTGVVSIAIRPYLDALGGARFVVLEKKSRVLKSVAGAGHSSRDDEYEPVDADHPLAHIIEHPGGEGGAWSMQQECAYLLLQKLLTGDAPMWMPVNEDGRPVQCFALTGASVQANASTGVSQTYPNGSYRVINALGNTMWFAGLGATSAVLPAEQLHFFRDPHPLWRNAGMSRMQCGALEIDVLEAITRSRWSYFDTGAQLGVVIYVPGATPDECTRLQQDFMQKHSGARNAYKVLVTGGAGAVGMDGKPISVQQLSQSARELDYQGSYPQAAGTVAALFKTPLLLLGLSEGGSSSYAADWAAQRRFYDLGLSIEARNLSVFLTKHLAHPWCEFPGQYRIEVEIDPPQNVEAEASERQSAAEKGLIYVNEYRTATNRKPVPDGDVPLSVYLAKLQQAAAPQPDPMALGGGGAKPPAPAEGGKPGDPLSGLLERKDGPEEPRQKAMSALDDSAGGALVLPACSPAEKRRKKKRLVADVLKRL
ncbi:MAG: phage portal protein [Rhizobium sp.]|nr:MAG: phage portal protein [Rhizobium sp.]